LVKSLGGEGGLDGERGAANLPAAYNKKGVSDNFFFFFFFGGLQEGAGGWFAPGRLGVEGQRGARSASPSHWRGRGVDDDKGWWNK
jgi:hypothetical protein